MKVLISAYSCEPNGPSEQDVGWNWALQAARDHEVWVLTNSFPQQDIQHELAKNPVPNLHFAFHPIPMGGILNHLPKDLHSIQYAAYLAWQATAIRTARRLHEQVRFDVAHHLTWATARFPTFLAWLDVPFVWGPIGGGESAPAGYYRSIGRRAAAGEMMRDASNFLSRFDPFLRRTASRASRVLTTTEETRSMLAGHVQPKAEVYPAIGISTRELDGAAAEAPPPCDPGTEAKLLFVGRLISWKGCDLAIEALARLNAMGRRARLTVIGGGPEAESLRGLASGLDVEGQVDFLGTQSRAEVLRQYRRHDVFLFPSLHDSGGIVVLEAMYLGLPVVCVDAGGPAVSVGDAGIRVPCTSRDDVIAGLAAGVKSILDSPSLAEELRNNAKQRVRDLYDWDAKPLFLRGLYRDVATPAPVS